MDISFLTGFFNEQLLLSASLGALIGLERELSGKDPSLRTFALICMGSCMFGMISQIAPEMGSMGDPGRISAQVVSGIGFIGAGAIFKSRGGVLGLTTAALMWVTAAIGLAVAYDKYEFAISCTIISLIVIVGLKMVHKIIRFMRPSYYSDQSDFD